jgi:hypothetical protein
VSDWRHDQRLHDQSPTGCSVLGSSETKSWEWFLHRIQDQEKPKRKLNTHTDRPVKQMELKPSRGKSTIYNLVPSKEKGWHHRSVLGEVTCMKDGRSKNLTLVEMSPYVTCKSQASN